MDFMACWLASYKNSWEVLKKLSWGGGGSTLKSNPQPLHVTLLFILHHITIFLFYFIIYNRKGNPFAHILLKNVTPFTYMYLVNNFSFLITGSSRLMV